MVAADSAPLAVKVRKRKRMTVARRLSVWMAREGGAPSEDKPSRPVKIIAKQLCRRLNCDRTSLQNELRKMEADGIIEQVAPSKRGPYGHAGIWRLLQRPDTHEVTVRKYWTTDILYWMARKHSGLIDLEKLSKQIGTTRSGIREALCTLQNDGVISWERTGSKWNLGRLHPVRRYQHTDDHGRADRNFDESQHPEEFFAKLKRLREAVSVSKPDSTFSPPPCTPPSLLTTTTTTQSTHDNGGSTVPRPMPEIAWRIEVSDVVSELVRTARRMDPLADLPNDPYAEVYRRANPPAYERLRGLEMAEQRRNESVAEATRRVIKSTGAKTAAKMPKASGDRRQTTLYRVGTAKMAALVDAFRGRIEDYVASREDTEAVRSPKIGWHCDAWVEHYIQGDLDYDRYELEFDPETDPRFLKWAAGLKFMAQNDAIWEQFWALVRCEVEELTQGMWDEEALRTIETWVTFGGDYLAEQIGHKTGVEAWLTAGRVLAQWFFWPMHDDLRGEKPRLDSEHWKWVTLFAVGFAQENADLMGSHLRKNILTSLAAIRYKDRWALSAGMQERLGLGEDFSAIKQEGSELLAEYSGQMRDSINAPEAPTFHVMLSEALGDPQMVREIYDTVGGAGDLPEVYDFANDPSPMHYVSPYTAEYFEVLAEWARRHGNEEAEARLQKKADILNRHEQGEDASPADVEILMDPVEGYDDDEIKTHFQWLQYLFPSDRASEETEDVRT